LFSRVAFLPNPFRFFLVPSGFSLFSLLLLSCFHCFSLLVLLMFVSLVLFSLNCFSTTFPSIFVSLRHPVLLPAYPFRFFLDPSGFFLFSLLLLSCFHCFSPLVLSCSLVLSQLFLVNLSLNFCLSLFLEDPVKPPCGFWAGSDSTGWVIF